jgi:putative phage-type endonuclease
MKQHTLEQGSPAWHAHRLQHFNASDAPAMMGCSKYKTRTQLLHELKTGLSPDVDAATQRRFDAGHRFEALARPLAEEIIGEDLYPVVGTEGELSASFDGLTMDESIGFEHKTLNDELRAAMVDDCDGGALPLAYRVQMEQQCMVSGATRILFMASKWDGDDLIESRHCWYESDQHLADDIADGWAQFARDLAAYVPPEPVAPKPTAKARESLPALIFEAKGEITTSNLDAYKAQALEVLDGIPTKLETDQQFADGKEDAKFCRGVQEAMEQAQAACLGRMVTVDQAIKAMEHIAEVARRKAIDLENAIEAEEKIRKAKMLTDAAETLKEHVKALNTRIGKEYMPPVAGNFAAVIKGKRSVPAMQDAIDTELARAKIEANAVADRIDVNLKHLAAEAADHGALFPDEGTIVLKAADDFAALVKLRISDFQAQEDKRKAEELAKAAVVAEPVAEPAAAPAPAVFAMPVRTSAPRAATAPTAPTTHPTLSLGQIKERIAPLQITAEGMATLGFTGLKERGSVLYHEAEFGHMLATMVDHLQAIHDRRAA